MKPIYIHFDGLDLAGKTTTVDLFVKKAGGKWEVRTNTIVQVNPITDFANKLKKGVKVYDQKVLGYLYAVALLADIKEFHWPEVNTVQDSATLLRSLAYHTAMGNSGVASFLMKLIQTHPKFDASFILTASVEARLDRLKMREKLYPEQVSPGDKLVLENSELLLTMEASLVDIGEKYFDSVVINTTSLAPDEVIKKVFEHRKLTG
ncbi:MAG: hypothetical protein AAB602_01080 [Patescibacteria group bacterium]